MQDFSIDLPVERIRTFCQSHHISNLALYGSVLRSDFTPESDVDILVEFEPGWTPGLSFFTMQEELSRLLGRRVDLNTPAGLSRYFREDVLRDAEVVYDAS